MSLLAFYTTSLKKHPRITNSLTTGFLFGTGDVLAQFISPGDDYDYKRTLRAAFYGSVVFAFIGDKWYKILSKIKFPGQPLANPRLNMIRNGITKTSIDQLGFAPLGIPLYYSIMTLLENKKFEEVQIKLKENWLPTLKVNWMIWPIFQIFNLSIIPVQHQLMAVNILSIFWNSYLSLRNAKKGEDLPVHSPPVPE
ncbi:hypothetical protein BN7_2234 [Wickerhamomyces ciferrii]|uniref:Protein SYM1 n=1 Tax=Wickerhamomyces ciferrii (strain ATCC 14091 / BCRC 22168 / CBS 111 / JCM 3599 / NBRC 0793 / NRRL Y-1031 F-60-10) TaxID=1206466 RepID=K0KC84_WICCF|nr:uncharacterized protein BN7_2234 [Wickerhamomyces ciferrii]CCH42690.1 hypothetical protein BN7_2234 [Wickerhamomyces ciferrii]